MSMIRPRQVMRRRVTLTGLLVVSLYLCLAAHARGAGISIIPPDPTDQDFIAIRIEGGRSDGCWSFEGIDCLPIEGYTIPISVYWLDYWEPAAPACPTVAVEYLEHCAPGVQLPPGTYTVVVTEYNDSLRDPGTYVTTLEFIVDSVIGMRHGSWGAIKMIHR